MFGQSHILYLTSKFRNPGESTSSFSTQLQPAIMGAKAVDVVTAEIPVSWTPFDEYNNNIFFSTGDAPQVIKQIKLSTSKYYYQGESLATDLTALFAAEQALHQNSAVVITVTFDEPTLSLVITATNEGFMLHSGPFAAYDALGWGSFSSPSYLTSWTPLDAFSLQRTQAVYVTCNFLNSNTTQGMMPNAGSILCKVPVTGNTGSILTYFDSSTDNSVPLDQDFIQNVQISLVDDSGLPLDLRGRNCSFQLNFRY